MEQSAFHVICLNEIKIIRPVHGHFILKMAFLIIFASGPYQSQINLC